MLTERQEEILRCICAFQRAEGVAPSTRELAKRFGRSQPTMLKHLQALAKKGRLEKLADGRWGTKHIDFPAPVISAPVFGSVPAGLPTMVDQLAEEHLVIDPTIFGVTKPPPDHLWLLRVSGDSMIDAGIRDGDLVALVRREPKSGDIIAALVDETTSTLKRFVQEGGRTVLRAANPRFEDIVPQRLEAQGVMIGLIRRQAQ